MNAFLNVRSFARIMAVALLATSAGAAQAQTTTLGDGAAVAALPGQCPVPDTGTPSAVPVDAFTMGTTAVPNDLVSILYVQLYPSNAYEYVDLVEIRNDSGALPAIASVKPSTGYLAITIPGGLAVTSAATQYKVYVTLKKHSLMPPAVAGGEVKITARVTDFRSRNARIKGDATSTSQTIDNQSPGDVLVNSLSAASGSITVGWSTTSDVLVLRRQDAPVGDAPVDGVTSYTAGASQFIGSSTIACVGNSASCVNAGLTPNRPYYFKIFNRDSCANYSLGTEIGPIVAAAGGGTEGNVTASGKYMPVVGLLNPAPGAAMSTGFKVQVRVFSPKNAVAADQNLTDVAIEYEGQATGAAVLTQNMNYGGVASRSGIWESGAGGLVLAAGKYTLRARATNATGTVYSGRIGLNVVGAQGDGNLLVRDNSSTLCTDCHASYQPHSAETTSTKYGSWYTGCRTCHTPHGTTNVSLVAERITPPALTSALPPAEVHFSTRTGFAATGGSSNPSAASFANADGTGPCQVCHTQTTKAYNRNGTLTDHYPNNNCAGCHKHSKGFVAACTGCHGAAAGRSPGLGVTGTDTLLAAAPPVTPPTTIAPIVANGGVHLQHVNKNTYRQDALVCSDCHANFGHGDDDVDLGWSTLATADGASVSPVAGTTTPEWVNTPTCVNYCHGATLADGATPTKVAVAWGTPRTLDCGSCHGYPPALKHDGSPHPTAASGCAGCHPGYTSPTLAAEAKVTHLDGVAQGTSCTGCHGGTQTPVASADARVEVMPPTDADPARNSATTFVGVGAHVQHSNSATSLAMPLSCEDCHQWAAFPADTAHVDGSSAKLASLNWNVTNQTCSVAACHGSSALGGTQPTPRWTQVDGTFKACNACHGATPPITTNHPQNTTCADCHPGYDSVTQTVVRNTHVDGTVNANTATGCARCHGKLGTDAVAATSIDAAPGVNTNEDSRGNAATATNIAGVGAHNAHLQPRYFNGVVACTQCHPSPAYGDATHANGAAAVPFPTGSLARTQLPGDAIAAAPAYASATCSNTYCHGEFTGGTRVDLAWTGAGLTGTSMTCSSCHGVAGVTPLPPLTANHPQNGTCATCHTGYTSSSVAGALANHIDGTKDATTASGCARCHGKLGTDAVAYGVDAAPGVTASHFDSKGNTAVTVSTVGAHAVHVQAGAMAPAFACSVCHSATITGTTHANGALDLPWGTLAKDGTRLAPSYSTSAYTCSNVYCHSRANPLGGTDATPASQAWTVANDMGCASCHGDAAAGTLSPKHVKHLASGTYNLDCSVCHSTTGTRTGITTVANHVNGVKNTAMGSYNGATISGSYSSSPNYTCNNTYCHSQGTTTVPASFLAPTRTTLNWSTGVASTDCGDCHGGNTGATGAILATGSHAAHMNNATYLGGVYACATCHDATIGSTANDRLLDATTGYTNHINGQKNVDAVTSWSGTACASNLCHSDGTETPGYVTATWGSPLTDNCKACHGTGTGTYGAPDYAERVSTSDDVRNSHSKHVSSTLATAKTQCVDCHESTIDATGALKSGGTHLFPAGTVDITSGTGKKIGSYAAAGESCTNVTCHGNNVTPIAWGGPALKCSDCHTDATTDTDSFAFGTAGKVSVSEWTTRGHGQPAAVGGGSITPFGVNALPTIAAGQPCLYCHDGSVSHDVAGNPYRLLGLADGSGIVVAGNYSAASATTANQACLNCHGSSNVGVNPASQGIKTSTKKVDAYHYGAKHGTRTGGYRCWDCHDPHGDGTNIKMVGSKVVQTSTDNHSWAATRVTGVSFTANSAGTDYAGTGTKVCNACHVSTSYYLANGTGNQTHQSGTKCVSCHAHNQTPNLAFMNYSACSACHNAPPTLGKHLAHDSTTFSETAYTNNARHADASNYGFACNTCHNDGGGHMSDSSSPYAVGVTFGSFDTTAVGGSYAAGTAQTGDTAPTGLLTFDWTAGTCSSTYCHSNATPVGGTVLNNSVTWTETAWTASNKCLKCHKMSATLTVPDTNLSHSHNMHTAPVASSGYFFNCSQCHNGVATGASDYPTTAGTIVDKTKHVSGTHTVAFDAAVNPGTTAYNQGPAYTCSNTYCHSNGTNAGTPPANTSIAWNASVAADCTSCHAGNATAAAKLATNDHAAHMNQAAGSASPYLGSNIACGRCHAATVGQGNDRAISDLTKHVNRSVEVSMVNADASAAGTYGGASTKTCSSVYCHSDGTETPGNYDAALDWDAGLSRTNDCKACHGTGTGTYGAPDYAEHVATSDDVRNSHSAHVSSTLATAKTQCVNCHEGTVDGTGALVAGALHLNKVGDVTSGTGKKIGSYNATGESCTNVTCHGNNVTAVSWGGAALTCSDCHGRTAANGGDANSWVPNDNTISFVNTDEWTAVGHGSSTVNLAQGKTGIDTCRYCHDWNVSHDTDGTSLNPFRLLGVTGANGGITAGNFSAATNNGNGVCFNCHSSGGTGVDPDGSAGTSYLVKGATKFVNAYHYGTYSGANHDATHDGGQRCWDCHDPHGDGTNLAMIGSDTLRDSSDLYGMAGTRSTTNAILTSRTAGGYATTGAPYTGICQVCHTTTDVWRADGTLQTHQTNDCMTCHDHNQAAITDAFKGSGECIQCHAGQKGTTIVRRAIVTEFSQTWSHKRSGGRTVTNADCAVCHMEAKTPADPTMSTVHGDGYINLRDPDTGSNIQGVSWSGTDAGAYTSTTTYLTFTQFSRNLGSKTLEAAVQAIQINQCLKCHDSNGAASTLARVPGAPNAGRPFNTTIVGAAYTGSGVTAFGSAGNVTDINSSFAVTNSSYHPVRGKQNNWYAKLSRLKAPWNSTTRVTASASTNSWGDLISCWDCHAPNGTASTVTLTSTVTAHGGATTLRGSPTVPTITAAASTTNESTLCRLCHSNNYASNTSSHGSGSAFTSGNSGMSNWNRYGCNLCHSSNYNSSVARPIRGVDVHGVNTLPPTGGITKTGRWLAGGTNALPIAFIRNTTTLATQQPARIGTSTYTAQCQMATNTPSGQNCNQGLENYGTGGTY